MPNVLFKDCYFSSLYGADGIKTKGISIVEPEAGKKKKVSTIEANKYARGYAYEER